MAAISNPAYHLPASTTEGETYRLNLQHEIMKTMLGGTHSAILPQKVQHVADLGCGTGIWTREFAALHPEAEIIGVDLNPPSLNAADPNNVQFVMGDLEKNWHFAAQPFEYIWTRFLVLGLKDWSQFLERISQYLAPGGCFEIFESMLLAGADDASTSAQNSAFVRLFEMITDRLRTRGIDTNVISHFGDMIQAAGLKLEKKEMMNVYLDEEVASKKEGRQTAEMARNMRQDLMLGLTGIVDRLFDETAHPTLVEARLLLKEVQDDIDLEAKSRGYYLSHVSIVARKPD